MPAKKKRPAAKVRGKVKAKATKPAKAKKPARAAAKAKPKVTAKPKAKAAKSAATGKARPVAKPAAAKPGTIVRDASVDAFMRGFAHPHKEQIERVRELILGLRSDVREGVKWNAPSFLTKDFFATFNFMGMDAFRLVLHTGAVPKPAAQAGFKINDPAGLLRWQGKDRALIGFRDAADVQSKLPALTAVLQQWIAVADTF
ncbi:MAG TPA: DUF1801 domain-containing protein [bacterium]